jgi:hypothetical protein
MILKVGHYYKTIRIRKGHWMKDLFLKVNDLHITCGQYKLHYIVDYRGYNYYEPIKNHEWQMGERFCNTYFKEITKEEYETEMLLMML